MAIWDLRFWDRFGEYFVAAVFLCVGIAKILSYRRSPKAVGAQPVRSRFWLQYACIVGIGLFEIASALALAAPSSLLHQAALAQLAVAGLALLTVTAGLYHAWRHQPTSLNVLLFLLLVYVAIARWV